MSSHKNRSPQRKSVPLRVSLKSAAKEKLHRLEEEYAEGKFDPWNPNSGRGNLTVSEAKRQFLKSREHLQPRSRETYREVLENWQLSPGLLIRDVKADHIRPYVCQEQNTVTEDSRPNKGRRVETVTVATLRKRYRHLRTFFNWALEQKIIDQSPLDNVQPPNKENKVPEFLTPEQLQQLFSKIDQYREQSENRPGVTPDVQWLKDLIHLVVCTGMRRGELCNLRWDAVDLENGFITVRNDKDFRTKSGHERRIPIAGEASDVLRRRASDRTTDTNGYVLANANSGKPIRPNYATKQFKKFVREAKLKNQERIRFHTLRHTCASWLVMKGTPIRVVQQILGHSTSTVTEQYAHLAPEVMQKAMENTFGTT